MRCRFGTNVPGFRGNDVGLNDVGLKKRFICVASDAAGLPSASFDSSNTSWATLRLGTFAFFSSGSSLSWGKGRLRLVGPGRPGSSEVAVVDGGGGPGRGAKDLAGLAGAGTTQMVGSPSRRCSFCMASAENMWKLRFSATGDGGGAGAGGAGGAEAEGVTAGAAEGAEGVGADGVGGRLRTC